MINGLLVSTQELFKISFYMSILKATKSELIFEYIKPIQIM